MHAVLLLFGCRCDNHLERLNQGKEAHHDIVFFLITDAIERHMLRLFNVRARQMIQSRCSMAMDIDAERLIRPTCEELGRIHINDRDVDEDLQWLKQDEGSDSNKARRIRERNQARAKHRCIKDHHAVDSWLEASEGIW